MQQLRRLPAAGSDPPLQLIGKIAVPQMTGTWDHLAVDAVNARLFLSAQDQQMVYVVDLQGRAPIGRIGGLFDRPQGELYVPESDNLIVTNGRDGRIRILRADTDRLTATAQVSVGADMIAYDPRRKELYVESGGTDSKRGAGWLAVIDPNTGELTGRIDTGYRAAALVMAAQDPVLYVAIPAQDLIEVIDTRTRRIIRRIAVPGRPASMALDEAGHRLFVATRTFEGDPRPPTFNVFDAGTGKPIASLSSKDGTENMFYDSAHRQIYSTSLEGFVQAYSQMDDDHYRLAATITTVPHSGTSQFLPRLSLLAVAAPPHANRPAEVWLFEARSAPKIQSPH